MRFADPVRALARYLRQGLFDFEYLEVDDDHPGMVPMVWPSIFAFFRSRAEDEAEPAAGR